MNSQQEAIVTALLERHGRTFAAEFGIDPAKNTPSPLFRLLRFALLASTRIGADTASPLLEQYGGDLRRLREAQAAWDECYPFADKLAPRAAARLGLGNDAAELAEQVPPADFARLVAALVRCDRPRDHAAILTAG